VAVTLCHDDEPLVKVIVFDNSRLGMVKLEQEQGGLPEGVLDMNEKEDFGNSGRVLMLRRGDRVRAMDGNAGRVEGVVVNSGSGRIVYVLVVAGPWWRRGRTAVPVDLVPGFGPEGIRVLLSREQLKELASVGGRRGQPLPHREQGFDTADTGRPSSSPSITHP
jgi:hypothetical protein